MDKRIILSLGIFLIVLISLINLVYAQVPTYHQFYGRILDVNGNLVTQSTEIIAYIEGDISGAVISENGFYGYNPLFFVEGAQDGRSIEFFVNGKSSVSYIFESEATTNLNLILSEVAQSPGGDGGGSVGGGGGGIIEDMAETSVPVSCVEKWICKSWSKCMSGFQARTCIDENKCGTLLNQPEIVKKCVIEKEPEISTRGLSKTTGLAIFDNEKVTGYLSLGIILIVIIIVFLIIRVARKKRKTIRKKNKNNKTFFVTIGILFLLMILIILIIAKPLGILIGLIIGPPTYHQFYGQISYENGTVVSEDMPIVAEINDVDKGSGTSNNKLYGYIDLFFVNNGNNGEEIKFYVYGILSGTYIFTNEETTALNLVWPCGNGVFEESKGEECDGADLTATCSDYGHTTGSVSCNNHCKIDSSACSTPGTSPGGTSSPGGGGGGETPRTPTCNESWVCSGWSNCTEEKQTRTCLDENDCNTTTNKPVTQKDCQIEGLEDRIEGTEQEKPKTSLDLIGLAKQYWYIPVSLILLIIISIVIIFLIMRKLRFNRAIEKIKSERIESSQ